MSSWRINHSNGDYIMEAGAPVSSDSLTIPAYYRLMVRRTRWLYAPNTQYGSEFYTARNKQSGKRDPRRLIDIAERALQPLVDDGRALEVSVNPDQNVQVNRNQAALKVEILDQQGIPQVLDLPPINGG